ncbi:MAG: hypothetical protein NC111_06415 [Bacteroides sp.]|nr:hypothetical protein [Bacteroides sp.]MCM1413119.1 hypothetical protein [Bacteroides sp.]MCM1472139.1 hypothetical protein [Bacteroides sp.]
MDSKIEKSKRGGARPGAGRKATGRKATKAITIQLMPEEAAILDRVERRSDFIREAIRTLAEIRGIHLA